MSRVTALILAVIAIVSFSTRSFGGFMTGNELLSQCDTDRASNTYYQDRASCIGYTTGIADALSNSDSVYGQVACFYERITRGQVRDIVVQYLRINPKIRHEPAGLLAAVAIAGAFPCGGK